MPTPRSSLSRQVAWMWLSTLLGWEEVVRWAIEESNHSNASSTEATMADVHCAVQTMVIARHPHHSCCCDCNHCHWNLHFHTLLCELLCGTWAANKVEHGRRGRPALHQDRQNRATGSCRSHELMATTNRTRPRSQHLATAVHTRCAQITTNNAARNTAEDRVVRATTGAP